LTFTPNQYNIILGKQKELPMYDTVTFRSICDKADAAGKEAVKQLTVIPMVVGQETSLFSGELDHSKPTYYVEDGVCGFAWLVFALQIKATLVSENKNAHYSKTPVFA